METLIGIIDYLDMKCQWGFKNNSKQSNYLGMRNVNQISIENVAYAIHNYLPITKLNSSNNK